MINNNFIIPLVRNFYAVVNANRESESKIEDLYEEPGELLRQIQQVPL